MDHLERAGRVQAPTRRVLAGNRLVVVRADGAAPSVDESIPALRGALTAERVAMGDPAHVPVGRYAEVIMPVAL
jgi:ABC-type molybdate transport system substrate-binding protein